MTQRKNAIAAATMVAEYRNIEVLQMLLMNGDAYLLYLFVEHLINRWYIGLISE